MISCHFFLLLGFANTISGISPGLGMPVFMVLSVLSGFFIMRVQARIEIFFIRRHLKRNPTSGWRVLAAATKAEKKKPLKRSDVQDRGLLTKAAFYWGADIRELLPSKLRRGLT
ncbi:hypothetical protein [Sulfitobacter noctilucicola]|nr:hypothetical protein [Sulfitobacter noctilucicola]